MVLFLLQGANKKEIEEKDQEADDKNEGTE